MKRRITVTMVLFMAVGAFAATGTLTREVRSVVERALAGEREAVARYEAFAAKAAEEGYPGAAALFRAQAKAESTHAERFAAMLRDAGVPVPVADPPQPKVWSTSENLHAAAVSETEERDGIYKEAIETCRSHGASDAAKVFDQTRDSEVEHSNLCAAAGRDMNGMKQEKAYYVCGHCGYTTDVKLPFCPSCQKREALDVIH
jgi:rubrerythrin